jgi:hypothetical protein
MTKYKCLVKYISRLKLLPQRTIAHLWSPQCHVTAACPVFSCSYQYRQLINRWLQTHCYSSIIIFVGWREAKANTFILKITFGGYYIFMKCAYNLTSYCSLWSLVCKCIDSLQACVLKCAKNDIVKFCTSFSIWKFKVVFFDQFFNTFSLFTMHKFKTVLYF